jgi:hypothetical protein
MSPAGVRTDASEHFLGQQSDAVSLALIAGQVSGTVSFGRNSAWSHSRMAVKLVLTRLGADDIFRQQSFEYIASGASSGKSRLNDLKIAAVVGAL